MDIYLQETIIRYHIRRKISCLIAPGACDILSGGGVVPSNGSASGSAEGRPAILH